MSSSNRVEVGYNRGTGEVFIKRDGKKSHMGPDEARAFADLLNRSAEKAEEDTDAESE